MMRNDGYERYSLPGWQYDRERKYHFTGKILCDLSSQADEHERLIHEPGAFAAREDRCSACRWFEVRIYRAQKNLASTGPKGWEHNGWVIETVGMTIVPGEDSRHRVQHRYHPQGVVAALTQTKNGKTFVPNISKKALDQAADADETDDLADVVDELLVFD